MGATSTFALICCGAGEWWPPGRAPVSGLTARLSAPSASARLAVPPVSTQSNPASGQQTNRPSRLINPDGCLQPATVQAGTFHYLTWPNTPPLPHLILITLTMADSPRGMSSDHDVGSPRDSSPSKLRTGFLQSLKNFVTGETESADEHADPKAERYNAERKKHHDLIKERDEIIAAQKRAIDAQARKIRDREDTMQELGCRVSELEHDLGQHRHYQSRLQRAVEEHRGESLSLRSQLNSSKRNEQQLESHIREFQVRAFDNMNGDTWTSGDDGTVCRDLNNLQSRIKSWVKKHALEEMNSVGRPQPG